MFNKKAWQNYQDGPGKAYQVKRHNRSTTDSKNAILTFLKEVEGRPVTYQEIALGAGFNSTGGTFQRCMDELRMQRSITREGKMFEYTYRVNHNRVNRTLKEQARDARKAASKPGHRQPKRASSKRGEDGLTDTERKVFNYIQNHTDKAMSLLDMGIALNIPASSAHKAVKELVSLKRIVKSQTTSWGTLYKLWDQTYKPEGPNLEQVAEAAEEQEDDRHWTKNEATLATILDGMAWEFIKATGGSQSLIEFLTWVGKKS